MGPVLIDIPMDVQQEEVGEDIILPDLNDDVITDSESSIVIEKIKNHFDNSERPLILFGAGVGLGNAAEDITDFINSNGIPFVSSWNGSAFFNHDNKNYFGSIGVYGNRGANFLLQSADKILVLGSRLDNRQRGNVKKFAPLADVLVLDVDQGELDKHKNDQNYEMHIFNFINSKKVFKNLMLNNVANENWINYCNAIKNKYFGIWPSSSAEKYNSLSPYEVVKKINANIKDDAIITVDDGANLCWVFQAFHRSNQTIYTAGGNSPMGYSFPAALGAAIHETKKQIICFTGDGSIQMNIQDLQTMSFMKLPIKLFILNNFGYGIIKQFQDTWFESRYEATGNGYSQPDFGKIADAYELKYRKIAKIEDINKNDLDSNDGIIFDVILHPNTLIEPKIDSGNPLHNMFPYMNLDDDAFELEFLRNLNEKK